MDNLSYSKLNVNERRLRYKSKRNFKREEDYKELLDCIDLVI